MFTRSSDEPPAAGVPALPPLSFAEPPHPALTAAATASTVALLLQ
jgi:hypothetical protein